MSEADLDIGRCWLVDCFSSRLFKQEGKKAERDRDTMAFASTARLVKPPEWIRAGHVVGWVRAVSRVFISPYLGRGPPVR